MTPLELIDLRGRCIVAKQYSRKIANAELYAAELEKEAGVVVLPRGVAKHSAGHLLALLDKVERIRSGQEAKPAAPVTVVPAAAPAPKDKPKKKARAKPKKSEDDTLPRVEAGDDSDDDAGDEGEASDG